MRMIYPLPTTDEELLPELYDHQKRIIAENPLWKGFWLGTGSAKTRTALCLSQGKTLIIVPKQQKLDRHWEKENEKFQTEVDYLVMSKETFRRDMEKVWPYDTVIIDESHYFASGLSPDTRTRNREPIPKMSQMYEALLTYIRKYPPKRLYLLSATPASKPMHVLAIAWIFGKKWDFFKFRARYYFEKKIGWRGIWIPRNDKKSKEELAGYLKNMGYTGQLSDYFDVPEQTHKTIYVELTKEQKEAIKEITQIEADPMAVRAKQRTIENGILYGTGVIAVSDKEDQLEKTTTYFDTDKLDCISDLAEEFPKILIFAAYTGQIQRTKEFLEEKGFNIFTLTGHTKDRERVIEDAEGAEKAIVIAQSSISSGYRLKSFNCVIFASLSRLVRDDIQGRGRVLSSDSLKKNLIVYLVVKGGTDEECYRSIKSGVDFNEKVMENI